jgi:predicted nucleic-acid-binding protein
MLLKFYPKGNPFMGNVVIVNRSNFLNETKQAFASTSINSSVTGHNSHFKLKNVIKSAIGEWIERASLFNDEYKDQDLLLALNILNGEIIEVEKDYILFKETTRFNDSCGVASHLNSDSVIKSGFYEYFERQSLVFNWLTESEGIIINYKDINHDYINHLINANKKFVDELYIFDISLHKSIKVIMALGFGQYYKSVGMSANFSSEQAIIGALEEMLQTFGQNWTKGYVDEINNDKNYQKMDAYLEYYHRLKPDEMKEKYSYLINSKEEIQINDFLSHKNIFSTHNLKKISDDLNLQPYCTFIPPFYEGVNTKIIRVFSLDGYPHMHPPAFSEKETFLTFNKDVKDFPNAYKPIPFP